MKTTLDPRLIEFLNNRGITDTLDDFLNPNIKMLLNPFDLNGMYDAVEKLRKAIEMNKKILVFGDYDCDGISAACILVLYLKSKGACVDAFIPSRFEDGYGLSSSTISEICQIGKPDLLITVDLGITAVKEVEQLKQLGIDVIITDHHEPMENLPNCTVIDAKIPGQKYGFDGLCGAGVALKIVEAMESKKYVERYLDICAIATIGDIVPLINENRVIAKLGLEKINKGECLESIKFLINKLELGNLSSEDVSFRLVPRLNASGRMDNGKKVLDFLVETNPNKLEELYSQIELDNNKRLTEISNGIENIETQLKNVDVVSDYCVLVCGDFHQGVLGILASRVCHDYNRPCIIFTKTEDGTLKGSGRSIDGINIHSILSDLQHLLIRFGGHKMAIGIELLPQNFEEFKQEFNSRLKQNYSANEFLVNYHYDIEITDADINLKFINNLKMLEPFGCGNEKPSFMLKANNLICEQMKGKNYKHYKLHTINNKQIVAFNAYKHIEMLKSNSSKQLFVELEVNVYNGKKYPCCKLKDVKFDDKTFTFNNKLVNASSIVNRYLSYRNTSCNLQFKHLNEESLIQVAETLAKDKFGTVIICQNQRQLELLLNNPIIKQNYIVSSSFLVNKQNCIIIKSTGVQSAENGYKNYIYLKSGTRNEHFLFDNTKFVYDQSTLNNLKLASCDRKIMGICYNLIVKNHEGIFANDIFEFAEKLNKYDKSLNLNQILFAILVFDDLDFISVSGITDVQIKINNKEKNNLNNSKFYRDFTKNE